MTRIHDEDAPAVMAPADGPDHDHAGYGPEDVLPARPPGRRAKPPVEGTPSPIGRVVLPLALALVGVVAVFAAWGHLQSENADNAASAGQASSSLTVSAAPTVSSTPSVEPSSAPTSAEPSVTPSTSPSVTADPSASATTSDPAIVIDRSVPVTVLNGTRRTGLASRVAADLRKLGWTVVSVGNWRAGGVATTTVFVQGRADAAATMRRDLDAADATKATIGAMRTNRITVVVMDDYPKS